MGCLVIIQPNCFYRGQKLKVGNCLAKGIKKSNYSYDIQIINNNPIEIAVIYENRIIYKITFSDDIVLNSNISLDELYKDAQYILEKDIAQGFVDRIVDKVYGNGNS